MCSVLSDTEEEIQSGLIATVSLCLCLACLALLGLRPDARLSRGQAHGLGAAPASRATYSSHVCLSRATRGRRRGTLGTTLAV